MNIYKNTNGTFDVVNENNYLFHLSNDNCKIIGRVNENWQPSGVKLTSYPRQYKSFKILIEIYKHSKDQ